MLHIEIYLYCTNSKRHISLMFAFNMQNTTIDDFNCVLHVERKHRTCASFCYLYDIDIFQYVTQNSRCTCKRQNTLYFIVLELMPMDIWVSKVHIRGLSGKFADTVHTRANPSNNIKLVLFVYLRTI